MKAIFLATVMLVFLAAKCTKTPIDPKPQEDENPPRDEAFINKAEMNKFHTLCYAEVNNNHHKRAL